MSGYIDASPEALMKVSKNIDEFKKEVISATEKMYRTLLDVQRESDSDTFSEIARVIEEIRNYNIGEEPTLDKLKCIVSEYASKILLIKKILQGK